MLCSFIYFFHLLSFPVSPFLSHLLTVGGARALIKLSVLVTGCWDLLQTVWWGWTLSPLALGAQAELVLLTYGLSFSKNMFSVCGKGLKFCIFMMLVVDCCSLCVCPGCIAQVSVKVYIKLKEFKDSWGRTPSSWEYFPPFLLTMHYLVTETSQALLSFPWWMVPGTPQWPQWLASADKALNGFRRKLIVAQSPEDTTRPGHPLTAGEIETWPTSIFSSGLTFWPLKVLPIEKYSNFRKITEEKNNNNKTVEDITGAEEVSGALRYSQQRPSQAVITKLKWHFNWKSSSPPFFNTNSTFPASIQRGSMLPNFQPDSSYHQRPIPMIYVTGWLCFSVQFLMQHAVEIVGRVRYLDVDKIVSEGPEQRWVITAISVLCEVRAEGSVSCRVTNSRSPSNGLYWTWK